LIVNVGEAVQAARKLRKRGFLLKRRRKGLWWVYDGTSLGGLTDHLIGAHPAMSFFISEPMVCAPGRAIVIKSTSLYGGVWKRPKFTIEYL